MISFKPIKVLHPEIVDDETFAESDYADIPKALGVRHYKDCLFATSLDDENVSETYYELEGNGECMGREEDVILIQMDEIRFALLCRYDNYIIVIHKSNKEVVENLF